MAWLDGLAGPAGSPVRRPAAMQQVGRCDIQKADAGHVLGKLFPCLKRFRRNRAGKDDGGFGVFCRAAQPIAALQRIVPPAVVLPRDLRDGARAESQIDGTAVGPLQMLERPRSEEHTSELQSLMRISYAVFFLKKK